MMNRRPASRTSRPGIDVAAKARTSAARSPPNASTVVDTRLANEVLGVCADSLVRWGVRQSPALRKVPRLATARYARRLLADATETARVQTRWQRQTDYLDEQGYPRSIALRGPAPSFQALCRDCGVDGHWERLLAFACRFGLCSRLGNTRLTYVSDVVLLTGNRTLLLARAAVTVERYLRTAIHNAKPGLTPEHAMGDVTTEVSLSSAEFARLSKSTRRFLGSFIESTDRQLLAGVARDKRLRRTVKATERCGVTAFVFRDRR